MSATDPKASSGTTALRTGGWGGMATSFLLVCAGLLVLAESGSTPLALPVSLLALGVGGALASFLALRRMRIAWAFAVSLHGTMGLVLLLGTPKLRGIVHSLDFKWFNELPLTQELLLCSLPALLAITVTVFLALAGDQVEP